ncbi:UNVERIFIED_CONTAM: hypothetical protein Sradi_5253800 [Sesamum radiatum]|uniref:Uncharacterized protein n=1 Tax=Sesamum radiatum TaxID=300843 RepID=A0AAW2LLM7_SESRA
MEVDLARLGQSLVLKEEEDLGVVMPARIWHSYPDSGAFHPVGCVLSYKPYHLEALKTVLKSSLNLAKECRSPSLRMIALMLEHDNPTEVDLSWCDFHVHIHGLPLGKMTFEIASFIGQKLGHLKDCDLSKGPKLGFIMCLRIAINVSKPLPQSLKLQTVLGDKHTVTFTYECLPNFCYLWADWTYFEVV